MEKKKSLPRKQKRAARKILFLSFIIVGICVGIGTGIFGFNWYESHQSPFVSPLASAEFAAATKKDSQIEQLRKGLKEADINHSEIKRNSDSTFSVPIENAGEVIFSAKKDIPSQIASLQYILSHLTMEDRQFKRLDLRYDKPTIIMK